MQKEGTARLDFIQNIEYKFIELLSIDFVNSPDDTVRKQIAFRYNSARAKLEMMQDRINVISNLVKIKNPSLMLQIQKAPAASTVCKCFLLFQAYFPLLSVMYCIAIERTLLSFSCVRRSPACSMGIHATSAISPGRGFISVCLVKARK